MSPARSAAGTVCMLAGVILVATAPIGGWRHRDIRPIAISNANAYTSRPIETALVLNTPFSMIRSIGNVPFKDPHYFDDKELLASVYTPLHSPSAAASPADSVRAPKAPGKNLCVIIIESFGREYIGALNHEILGSGYKGFTPSPTLCSPAAHGGAIPIATVRRASMPCRAYWLPFRSL